MTQHHAILMIWIADDSKACWIASSADTPKEYAVLKKSREWVARVENMKHRKLLITYAVMLT